MRPTDLKVKVGGTRPALSDIANIYYGIYGGMGEIPDHRAILMAPALDPYPQKRLSNQWDVGIPTSIGLEIIHVGWVNKDGGHWDLL